MQIYGWKLLVVCHQPDKSYDHKHCDSEELMFLIGHVTSRQHMLKRLYEFMGGNPSH